MHIDEALHLRRSIRGFLPREVPEATIREIFDRAQLTLSKLQHSTVDGSIVRSRFSPGQLI